MTEGTTARERTARELLEAALNTGVLMRAASPGDVIQTNTPGVSVDGSLLRQKLLDGIASDPSGAILLDLADAGRACRSGHGAEGCAYVVPSPTLATTSDRAVIRLDIHGRVVNEPALADALRRAGEAEVLVRVAHQNATYWRDQTREAEARVAALEAALREVRAQSESADTGFYPWARSALVQALVNIDAYAVAALAHPTPARRGGAAVAAGEGRPDPYYSWKLGRTVPHADRCRAAWCVDGCDVLLLASDRHIASLDTPPASDARGAS